MNPGWDTPKGQIAGTARLIERWESTTTNDDGNPNTVFLKATVPDPEHLNQHITVGAAIWTQLSMVKGRGDTPSTDLGASMDLQALLPGEDRQQRFLRQIYASLVRHRVAYVQEIETADSPSVFVLDLCVVHPAWQRRGIAVQLVRWGLDEAKRRGGLEATTEASAMGRHVYGKMGFQGVVEIEYEVDEEFKGRDLPPNLFMRTGGR